MVSSLKELIRLVRWLCRVFRAGYVCRFCMATIEQLQATEVRGREFPQRTKASHDLHVQTVQESDTSSSHFGVAVSCVSP